MGPHQEILPSLRTFTNKAERTWTCPDVGPAEPRGHKPLVVNVVVVGPFEEEEEGTGIASDVIKVEGEDLATPEIIVGILTRGHPGNVTIPQCQVNTTKQYTPSLRPITNKAGRTLDLPRRWSLRL